MCVANNASVDINLNMTLYGRRQHTGTNLSFSLLFELRGGPYELISKEISSHLKN